MTPTKQQLTNILSQASFLMALPPPETNKFDMDTFATLNNRWEETLEFIQAWDNQTPYNLTQSPQPECGFSACALGWAIHNPDVPKPQPEEDWEGYSERVFGLYKHDDENRDEQWGRDPFGDLQNPFEFAFFSAWKEDEQAAAARLMKIYEHFSPSL